MKKILIALCILLGLYFIATAATGCTSVKKDCRGVKHYRQANGIYL